MNFIVQLPPSQGFTTIFIVVDRLSKFGYFIPLKPEFNNKVVDELFITNIVKIHGFPKTIVSDRENFYQHFLATIIQSSRHHIGHEFFISPSVRWPD